MKSTTSIDFKYVPLILGGGNVTGYSIIQELWDYGLRNIMVVDFSIRMSGWSRLVSQHILIKNDLNALNDLFQDLKTKGFVPVLYPATDEFVHMLLGLNEENLRLCGLSQSFANHHKYLMKNEQYQLCEEMGISYPKTISIINSDSIKKTDVLRYPVIIKTETEKASLKKKYFKAEIIGSKQELLNIIEQSNVLSECSVLVSEYIEGGDEDVWALTAFVGNDGKVKNFWTGRKLGQYPVGKGVFSSSCSQLNQNLVKQAVPLIEAMGVFGIIEPEFKYSKSDDKYYLMEVNLRPMMWHRLGFLAGVPLCQIQWEYFVNGVEIKNTPQQDGVHYSYLRHELANLILDFGYIKLAWSHLTGGNANYLAIFNWKDPGPFTWELLYVFPKTIGASCLRKFKKLLKK